MISKIYISHCEEDERLALELAESLGAVNLECFVSTYKKARAIPHHERIAFGMRHSDCVVVLLTLDGMVSPLVNQEIGLAVGMDHLIIPLAEAEVEVPTLLKYAKPIRLSARQSQDAIGELIRSIRDLTTLQWLRIKCPICKEEITQYLPPQEEVDRAILSESGLETICNCCETALSLDPRTFKPSPSV